MTVITIFELPQMEVARHISLFIWSNVSFAVSAGPPDAEGREEIVVFDQCLTDPLILI